MNLRDPKEQAAYRQGWNDCLHEMRRRVTDAITPGQMEPALAEREHEHLAVSKIERRMLTAAGFGKNGD